MHIGPAEEAALPARHYSSQPRQARRRTTATANLCRLSGSKGGLPWRIGLQVRDVCMENGRLTNVLTMMSLSMMLAASDQAQHHAAAATDRAAVSTQWEGLTWCPRTPAMGTEPASLGHTVGVSACVEATAEQALLRAKFCEALVGKPPICPEQWFSYLETTRDRWIATFPHCEQVGTPTAPVTWMVRDASRQLTQSSPRMMPPMPSAVRTNHVGQPAQRLQHPRHNKRAVP